MTQHRSHPTDPCPACSSRNGLQWPDDQPAHRYIVLLCERHYVESQLRNAEEAVANPHLPDSLKALYRAGLEQWEARLDAMLRPELADAHQLDQPSHRKAG